MKGWRTLLLNAGIVIGTGTLTWAAGVNWSDYVSPSTAVILTAAVNMGLRLVTNTPVGKSN